VIVAIDGPAGSGKSSTARLLAKKLGFIYLDTGSMYRAIALLFQRLGIEPGDSRIAEILDTTCIEIRYDEGVMHVLLDEEDVSDSIRSTAITELSSRISTIDVVREKLVAEQRRMAMTCEQDGGGVVMEGRDIGTVVFPDAEVKFFLVADASERARRRLLQYEESGIDADYDQILADIVDRDIRDTSRKNSPLKQAEDAKVIDTTHLSFDEQVTIMEAAIRERRH